MNANDLGKLLSAMPANAEVLFESWVDGQAPEANYGIDDVMINDSFSFVVLISQENSPKN